MNSPSESRDELSPAHTTEHKHATSVPEKAGGGDGQGPSVDCVTTIAASIQSVWEPVEDVEQPSLVIATSDPTDSVPVSLKLQDSPTRCPAQLTLTTVMGDAQHWRHDCYCN